jgi:fibronectin type 3 domain-containing protein
MKTRIFAVSFFFLFLAAVSPFAAQAQAAPQHNVTLTWVAGASDSSHPAEVTFNVYRSTVTGGSYVKIGSTTAPVVTYADTTGIAGTKYFYVITGVDANGFESVFSSEVSATPIANPNPPTGVTAKVN